MSITQADNECRLEGDKTHEISHFLSKKVGGTISYVVLTKLKSGGTRPPPSPTDLRPWVQPVDVPTLASKRSESIRNAAIVRKRHVIHKQSTCVCVCLRLPFAARNAGTQERKVDLWPPLIVAGSVV